MKITMVMLAMIIAVCAFAGKGKIAGIVTDAETGEALKGVNIQLFEYITLEFVGGAATDFDGKYFILNIKPGIYKIRASYVGYGTQIKDSIEIFLNSTTEVSFSLDLSDSSAIVHDEISIFWEKIKFPDTATHSIRLVDSTQENEVEVCIAIEDTDYTLTANFDSLPEVTLAIKPQYPELACRASVEGFATVCFNIDSSGKAIDGRVSQAHPEGFFESASLTAIKEFVFETPENYVTPSKEKYHYEVTFFFNFKEEVKDKCDCKKPTVYIE